ncbi:MAG: ROK family glucokinase [Candidatus Sumerlaeaceae bacterium]|nr:ROK family glucokinase [Candidatus Sumerlaeaceae bacterium]
MLMLGIDLGGTDIKFGLVDKSGRLIHKTKYPTHAHLGFEGVMQRVAEFAREVIASHDVAGIGMGVPGPMSSALGIVYEAPNLPGWENVPVRDHLQTLIGLPVVLHNDANAAAYGEFWAGAGRGCSNMVLFSLGTGVGGGLILNGELYSGPDDTAGELGHIPIDYNGPPCNCGSRGCVEAYASATAIRRIVREALAKGVETSIRIPKGEEETFGARLVYEAALAGDAFAKQVLYDVGKALGIAAAAIINILNPERIIYAGAMIGAGEFIFAPLREYARTRSFRRPAQRAQILIAELGADAGIIGAAGLAFQAFGC